MTKFNILQDKKQDEKYYYAGIFDKSEEKLNKVCIKLEKEELFTLDFFEEDKHPTRTWITGYSVWVMANSCDFKNKSEFMGYLGKKLMWAKHDVHFNI